MKTVAENGQRDFIPVSDDAADSVVLGQGSQLRGDCDGDCGGSDCDCSGDCGNGSDSGGEGGN